MLRNIKGHSGLEVPGPWNGCVLQKAPFLEQVSPEGDRDPGTSGSHCLLTTQSHYSSLSTLPDTSPSGSSHSCALVTTSAPLTCQGCPGSGGRGLTLDFGYWGPKKGCGSSEHSIQETKEQFLYSDDINAPRITYLILKMPFKIKVESQLCVETGSGVADLGAQLAQVGPRMELSARHQTCATAPGCGLARAVGQCRVWRSTYLTWNLLERSFIGMPRNAAKKRQKRPR